MPKTRLHDIDRAKGLAIFLVVLGHLIARDPPEGGAWGVDGYITLKNAIYQFHMPFFMFLSGLVMAYTLRPISSFADYRQYVSKKFMRLVPAYALLGVLIMCGKIWAARVVPVDNMPPDFWGGLVDLALWPNASSASSLWYIYVLFEFYLIVPLLLTLSRGRVWPWLIVGAGLQFVSISEMLLLNRICEYLLFLLLGCAAAKHLEAYCSQVDRYGWAAIGLFAASLVAWAWWPVPKAIMGVLSIPALHALVRRRPLADMSLLEILGKYCFPIYLLNTVAIGLTKGVLLRLVPWEGLAFLWIAPVLLLVGVLGPIVVKYWALPRVPFLDRITD